MQDYAGNQTPSFADNPQQFQRMTDLNTAADRLHEEIGAITRAIQSGSAIEKAEARDRFDMALADFASLIDQTAE